MAAGELTVDDVVEYTRGRLADDEVTGKILAAAVAAARNTCRWHVCPVRGDNVMVVDGSGSTRLRLPTLRIRALHKVESMVADGSGWVDITDHVATSSEVPGLLIRGGAVFPRGFRNVTVTLDHGFDPDEAPDWVHAVLNMADQMAAVVTSGGRSDDDLVAKQVDDVIYRWSTSASSLISADPLLAAYRLVFLGMV